MYMVRNSVTAVYGWCEGGGHASMMILYKGERERERVWVSGREGKSGGE